MAIFFRTLYSNSRKNKHIPTKKYSETGQTCFLFLITKEIY